MSESLRKVWVVEMLFEEDTESGWHAATGFVARTRDEAREELRRAMRNAGVSCRIRKYTPESSG